MRRGIEAISPWHCSGVMEAQVALIAVLQVICIVGSGDSHLPLTIPHRFSMRFSSGEFAGQSSTVTPWSLNQILVHLAVWAVAKFLLENEISISIKLVSRKHSGQWMLLTMFLFQKWIGSPFPEDVSAW